MIILDTNYLIRSLVEGTSEALRIVDWIQTGETLCTSGVAWYEFLCGPVDDEGIFVVRSLLNERILPFTADQAAEAARLFNETGRKRNLRVDAMIASAAIITGAELATENIRDFTNFTPMGLKMITAL
jgi:predicted nucleic acid-binding protein